MSYSRKVEVRKGAWCVMPIGDVRSVELDEGAVLVVYDPGWTPEQVAAVVRAARGESCTVTTIGAG